MSTTASFPIQFSVGIRSKIPMEFLLPRAEQPPRQRGPGWQRANGHFISDSRKCESGMPGGQENRKVRLVERNSGCLVFFKQTERIPFYVWKRGAEIGQQTHNGKGAYPDLLRGLPSPLPLSRRERGPSRAYPDLLRGLPSPIPLSRRERGPSRTYPAPRPASRSATRKPTRDPLRGYPAPGIPRSPILSAGEGSSWVRCSHVTDFVWMVVFP